MPKRLNLILSPPQSASPEEWQPIAIRRAAVDPRSVRSVRVVSQSVDARSRTPKVNMGVEIYLESEPLPEPARFDYRDVSKGREVIVVGSGPAGMFAALRLIEEGLRPIVLERGRRVAQRRKDITAIHRGQSLDPESNYAFGEGGAGTFSDGKLFTRSKKRGDCGRVLQTLVYHGASPEILYQAHPHIGSELLPRIVDHICRTIEECGGEVVYNARVDDLLIEGGKIEGVVYNGTTRRATNVVLATGHSAGDVYRMLARLRVAVEAKPFAVGVRVEHPQELINTIQYHSSEWSRYLGAAAYSLTANVDGRGVYSFCMCPGGVIVPAATNSRECVVNGMSASARSSQWANAALVTEVRIDDFANLRAEWGELAGLEFRDRLEQAAYRSGGEGQVAPAQRLTDFATSRFSSSLPRTSYTPGTRSSQFGEWLPDFVARSLKRGIGQFDGKMHGFLTSEAQIVGVESRTSTPVRIPRDPVTLMHPNVEGLYPSGEGAGYAGGIVSAAVDGDNVAAAIAARAGGRQPKAPNHR